MDRCEKTEINDVEREMSRKRSDTTVSLRFEVNTQVSQKRPDLNYARCPVLDVRCDRTIKCKYCSIWNKFSYKFIYCLLVVFCAVAAVFNLNKN